MICEACGKEFFHSKIDKKCCCKKCKDKKYYEDHKVERSIYYKKYNAMRKD